MTSVQTQARMWAQALNKKVKERGFEKIYEDLNYLANPDEVKRFETSEPCWEAVKTLEKFSVSYVGTVPKQTEFTLVRDFLLWQVFYYYY